MKTCKQYINYRNAVSNFFCNVTKVSRYLAFSLVPFIDCFIHKGLTSKFPIVFFLKNPSIKKY